MPLRLHRIPLLLGALFLSSCTANKSGPSFTGSWNVDSLRSTIINGGAVTEDITRVLLKEELRITFNEDKTYTWVNGNSREIRDTGTYKRDSAKLILHTAGGRMSAAAYVLSGNKMTLHFIQNSEAGRLEDLLYMTKE